MESKTCTSLGREQNKETWVSFKKKTAVGRRGKKNTIRGEHKRKWQHILVTTDINRLNSCIKRKDRGFDIR